MTTIVTKLNKFVRSFLSENETVLEEWNSKENQTAFKKELKPFNKNKRRKDPNAPKKAKSSYLFFCADKRGSVMEENPGVKNTEIISELGRLWQELDTRSRSKYDKQAAKDKARYEKEMEGYTPPESSDEDNAVVKRKKKDPDAPKRPTSSYLFFCKEERETVKSEFPEMKNPEIVKEMGSRWRELSEEDREQFQTLAAEDKSRYETEMEAYNGGSTPAKKSSTKAPAKTSVKKASTKAPAKAPAKKQTGYQLFVSENKADVVRDNSDFKAREITAALKEMWNELPEDVQQEYTDRC